MATTVSQPQNLTDVDLAAASPPYDYNTSAWSQRIPVCVLAAVGFVVSSWLALYQWGLIDHVWDPFFGDGTDDVLGSDLSHRMHYWMVIPDAALGAVAYLGDAVFGLAGSTRRWQYRPWMVILFGIDVIPLGIVSAILVACQGLVVGHWCSLCLFTAVISIVLIFFAYDEVHSSLWYLWKVWKKSGSKHAVWQAFTGVAVWDIEELIAEVPVEKAEG